MKPPRTYFVKHLSKFPDLSVEVTAPDSKHARTAFLDVLSRQGMIPWSDREVERRQVVAKLMQPGEIPTSMQASYYGPETNEPVTVIDQAPSTSLQPVQVPATLEAPALEAAPVTEPEQSFAIQPFSNANSPIMRISRLSGGR